LLEEATVSDGKVHMTLTLQPNEQSRELGFDSFLLRYKVVFGKNLSLRLTVENTSNEPFIFEEALHSYFSVGDAKQISIYGLVNTEYLDKTSDLERKTQTENILSLTGETDRPYINTKSTVYVQDPLKKRRLVISKENSATTVVWNPWDELAAKLTDMDDDAWQQMVCVETANALINAIELPPGKSHTMSVQIASNKTA
jgi:glucose-6-phosphate 1-epimerase